MAPKTAKKSTFVVDCSKPGTYRAISGAAFRVCLGFQSASRPDGPGNAPGGAPASLERECFGQHGIREHVDIALDLLAVSQAPACASRPPLPRRDRVVHRSRCSRREGLSTSSQWTDRFASPPASLNSR